MRDNVNRFWLDQLSGGTDTDSGTEVRQEVGSDQESFKENVKRWLRKRKNELREYAIRHNGCSAAIRAPYSILANLLGVSLSSVNNWLYSKGQKAIPEERVKVIEELMKAVPYEDTEEGQESFAEEDKKGCNFITDVDITNLVSAIKKNLTDAAFRKFYTEAEALGMTLDDYLRNLFK